MIHFTNRGEIIAMTETLIDFKGTNDYIIAEELQNTVNVAVTLGRPLLIKGEPGTGKTMLAKSIADSLGLKFLVWNIKSTTKAQEGMYVYDTVQRLYDSQFGDNNVSDIKQYIKLGKLGEAFSADERVVLLIDEIDKADIEFPNDLLWELDIMNFYIPETGETIAAKNRPIVIITSNAEKELPDAFLRRCIFHYIDFPNKEMMKEIIHVHHPKLEEELMQQALETFYSLRGLSSIQKKPSTSELLDWIHALSLSGISPETISTKFPFMGMLIKKDQDLDSVNKHISYMTRL